MKVRQGERTLEIETAWVGDASSRGPVIVFLHEGLGSVSMWKDFPQRLCKAAGRRGLVYSREGYGRSTPRPAHEHWAPDFMHRQAFDALPALLQALDLPAPYVLFGHSDGGSIALIHAATYPLRVAGVVALAPHIMVEEQSVTSIAQTREAWFRTDLRQRLARHHADVDSAFWGWNDAWLQPTFRDWSIEALLPSIRCPVLAIQGEDDEYGSMAQIDGIAERVPQAELLKLAHCGHSPHKDQPGAVIETTCRFLARKP
ncbi:MAG: alpha/beta hydrolase [Pseudomonadota bacterium]